MSRYFAKGREPVSSYTHFWGAIGGLAATALLAVRSIVQGNSGLVLAGCLLFGLSLVALYSASSVYHYARCAAPGLRRLRKLDHAMIYVLIAGSYTPFCVAYMQPGRRELFLGGLWVAAVLGILFKLVWLADLPGHGLVHPAGFFLLCIHAGGLPGPGGCGRGVLHRWGCVLHCQMAQHQPAVGVPRAVPPVYSGRQPDALFGRFSVCGINGIK